jgi:choline dehydrogenase-like flavoprotein
MQATEFDAIVIGSGITGGWAAKELTERGLKVLMLERGRQLEHGKDYPTEHIKPWELDFAGKPQRDLHASDYAIQRKKYAFDDTTRHFWNNDRLNPYLHENGQFHWFRGDQVGGRSLTWANQCYRWSDLDFTANLQDGNGIDWPIRYADLKPWYDHVESFAGISGEALGLPQLPDGIFQPPMELNVMERRVKAAIEAHYTDRVMTIGRASILTRPIGERRACHYCGPCYRGCSVGSYFSTQSCTLPAAEKTGRLTLLPDSVVASLDYSAERNRISAVRVINTRSGEKQRYTARLVFLCASAVASVQIMLNSVSKEFPAGMANSSGVLGRYLMDHTTATGAFALMPGMLERTVRGHRPNGIYIPRFRNVKEREENLGFSRGYGFQGSAQRIGWQQMHSSIPGFGADYKRALRAPGPWVMFLLGFGECLPYQDNRVTTVASKADRFGIPQVKVEFQYGDNEQNMRKDIAAQAEEMLKIAGGEMVLPFITQSVCGDAIHEMGGARMGSDPGASVLNAWCQSHDVPNLFVTDGACMTSSSCVNPSLSYMALTARAAHYAADQLGTGHI